jgi:D-alanyl-D-alanine carboxypeptidase (penicillin-binding protein 5/6)
MLKKLGYLLVTLAVCSQVSALDTKARHAFLLDATTGTVLHQKSAYQKMTPSSMSKLMTLYITFERLKAGDIKLQDTLPVSTNAWKMGGSKMFLAPNTFVPVESLLRGVIVQSGNDACLVLAEGIAGGEKEFVNLMNVKAAELGLKHTQFANATGMPDKNHYMSAADIGQLSARIIADFPDYYHYFSEKEFEFNNIKQPNRNTLLYVSGVDGLKTGHTDAGKYGIAASSLKDGRRLIAVVNGLRNEKERAEEAQKLLQHGFLNFINVTVSSPNVPLGVVPVSLGTVKRVKLGTKKPLVLTIPVANKGQTEIKVTYQSALAAPVTMEQKVGEVAIKLYNGDQYSLDLYPTTNIEKLGFFKSTFVKIKTWFKNFTSKEQKPQVETNSFSI